MSNGKNISNGLFKLDVYNKFFNKLVIYVFFFC